MAALTPQVPAVVGTVLNPSTPTATVGDTVPPGCQVLVRNGSGASINVTIKRSFASDYGVARGDVVVAVAAGAMTSFGNPFPADMADPANAGQVTIICSATASVQLFVIAED